MERQAHYNQRHKYYALLKDFENKKISLFELEIEFKKLFNETTELIHSRLEDPENFVSTPKSKDFLNLILQIWYEFEDPEMVYDMLQRLHPNLNSDSEELEILRENDLREQFKRISHEMEAFLDS